MIMAQEVRCNVLPFDKENKLRDLFEIPTGPIAAAGRFGAFFIFNNPSRNVLRRANRLSRCCVLARLSRSPDAQNSPVRVVVVGREEARVALWEFFADTILLAGDSGVLRRYDTTKYRKKGHIRARYV